MANLSSFVKNIRDIMRMDSGISGDAQRIEQLSWMLFLKIYDSKEDDWAFVDTSYTSILPEELRWRNWATLDAEGKGMTGDALLDFVNNKLFPVLKGVDLKDSNGNTIMSGIKVTADTPIKKAIVRAVFDDTNQYMKDGVQLRQVINVIDSIDFSSYEESHAFGEIYESILKEMQSAGSAGEFYTPRAVTDFMARMIEPQIGEQCADFAAGTGGFLTSWLKELEPKLKTEADRIAYDSSVHGMEKKQFPYTLCITNMLLHGIDSPDIRHGNSLAKNVLDYTDEDKFDCVLMNPPYGGSEKNEIKNHFPADMRSSETADLFMSVIMYRLKENGRAAVILPDGFLFGTDNAKINIKKKLLSEFNLHTIIRMPGSVFSPYTPITTNILFFDRSGPTKETWFYRLDMPNGLKHFSKSKPMEMEHFAPVLEWWNDRCALNVDGFDKARCYTVQELSEELGYNLDQCGYPYEEEEILPPKDLFQRYQEERASLNAIVDHALQFISCGLENDMPEPLSNTVNHALGRLAEIDKIFPDKMQKSILQFAIQGKLVEQYSIEGTGEELYRQIHREKQMLIKAGIIKKEKLVPEITDEEIPFEIPESWKWVRIANITILNPKNILPDDLDVAFIPMPCVADGYRNYHTYETRKWGDIKKGFTHFADGDIGVAKITPCFQNRKSVIFQNLINGYGAGTTELSIVRVFKNLLSREYLLWFFKTEYFISNGVKSFTGTAGQQRIHKDYLSNCAIPLPPLAEQKRIVARLEELLPLCERLK